MASCSPQKERIPDYSPFDDDISFLSQYGEVIVLTDSETRARVAVMPSLQGRVMTSTSGAPDHLSYGWINRSLFQSGDTSVHMNAFGGEERIWLGPEGGQFSIFFAPDSAFTFENWHTPPLIDLEPFNVVEKGPTSARFDRTATLVNYSGTRFDLRIEREVKILSASESREQLHIQDTPDLNMVAYQTANKLFNVGGEQWRKSTGLLSIWLLGMFNPSPSLTMVIPYNSGPEDRLGPVVNADYFGQVPADRLKVSDSVIFFKGDGEWRSKIGLNPARAKNVMGSFDALSNTLTIVTFSLGAPDDVYVNSKWEIQKNPYNGDVINAYNDGPPAPGVAPMGPFYELESSSPARELNPGEHIEHVQTTYHFQGDDSALDQLSQQVLGVSLSEIRDAF